MKMVFQSGPITIWEVNDATGPDFYVYSGDKLLGCVPSIGMAHARAARELSPV